MSEQTKRLSLLDWRRSTFAMYADVRRQAVVNARAAHELWRTGRDALFAEHPDSPLPAERRRRFHGLGCAPYDPGYRFEADVQPAPDAAFEAATGTDGVVPFRRLGRVDLPGLGTLDVWWVSVYGGGVFLPLKDATSGHSTYGGGRYVIDTVKGADLGGDARAGRLVVDLNFAYNPSCAYDEAWACPLAPPGNALATRVDVGELSYEP
jgi:uncharacterized protein (DUF1684 family)